MGVKLAIAGLAALILIPLLIVAVVQQAVSSIVGNGGSGASSQPSQSALTDIPADYLALYRAAAATCPGLDWSVLAGIGKVETNHGRSQLPGVHSGHNSAGAEGRMQFLAPTFATYDQPVPPGGAIPPSPYDPVDAIYAAARLLCANGARNNADIHAAIFAYNHADWYVSEVLTQAAQYSQAPPNSSVACASFRSTVPSTREQFSSPPALAAVAFACDQLGKPYIWGGNGTPGFDCSGLTHAAYATAGLSIPRTAQTQYDAGPLLASGTQLQPGDLVFFGTPSHIHHVGISLGGTLIVNAPTVAQPVQVDDLRSFADYAGASRPVEQPSSR
jgi:cell wall-associated NlpC family hydrolase